MRARSGRHRPRRRAGATRYATARWLDRLSRPVPAYRLRIGHCGTSQRPISWREREDYSGVAVGGQTPGTASRHVLFLNWRDTRNPEGGGSEVYVERIAGELVATGHRAPSLVAV